jgi:hypothetical protein
MVRRTFTVLVLGSALAFCYAHAQEIAPGVPQALSAQPPAAPGAFGGEIQQTAIPVTEFVPEVSGYSFQTTYGINLNPTAAGIQRWHAPLGLPSGAAIEEIRVLVRDDDAALDITSWLGLVTRAIDGSADCDGYYYVTAMNGQSTGISGNGTIVLQSAPPWVIRTQETNLIPCAYPTNYVWYSVMVQLPSQSHSLAGVVVRWRRSVSPGPVVATFNDVPTDHPLFQFVEALAASGITVGCGGGDFCPGNPLTRGQMAVFLAKALGLHFPL